MTNGPRENLSPVDRDALERCMEIVRRDPERAEQFDGMLSSGWPWELAADMASHCCQVRALSLRPWQCSPSSADENDPDEPDKDAQKLLRQMLRAGLSRFEPDPMRGLKARRRKT
jgi:hypothetical protein